MGPKRSSSFAVDTISGNVVIRDARGNAACVPFRDMAGVVDVVRRRAPSPSRSATGVVRRMLRKYPSGEFRLPPSR